jgi:RNA polymerase sigma factor (sigma-70 family)
MFQNKYGEHDAELVRIAMHFASGLVGNYGYTKDDADDLLQSLLLEGTKALQRFDEAKAKRSTFLYAALQDRVASLARHAQREKRDHRSVACSLDSEWPGDESGDTAWADVISPEETLDSDQVPRRDRANLDHLRMDMAAALAALPPDLRKLALLHSEFRSEDARQAAGLAYSSHHRAIKRIREHLDRWGLAPDAEKKGGRHREGAADHSTRTR